MNNNIDPKLFVFKALRSGKKEWIKKVLGRYFLSVNYYQKEEKEIIAEKPEIFET